MNQQQCKQIFKDGKWQLPTVDVKDLDRRYNELTKINRERNNTALGIR